MEARAGEPLSRKRYERKLRELHAELVKLQEWVKHAGAKNHANILDVRMGFERVDKKYYDVAATKQNLRRDFDVSALGA